MRSRSGDTSRDGWQHPVGAGIVLVIGGALSVVHLGDMFRSDSLQTVLTGAVVSLLFSVAIVGVGLWTLRHWEGSETLRLAGWTILGAVGFLLLSWLADVYIASLGQSVPFGLQWYAGGSSAGALLGSLLGLYDGGQIQVRQRWRAAKTQTDRLNEQLRRSNERLMVLNRVLRHNVRNDLNVVQGRAELIASRNDGADERDARTIADVATNLVEQSDKARTLETLMESRDDHRAIDLVTVLERELAAIGREYPNIVIDADVPDRLPVEATPSLDIAISNVLENSAKHNDASEPQITIDTHSDGDAVELTIADNGPGIPAHELDVLESGSETKLEHASGLGLWTAVWVVEHSDGEIGFEDNDPHGTVVRFRLPSADDDAVDHFESVSVDERIPT